MDPPNRTIRAPSTIIKPSKQQSTYTGYLAQNKFRILHPNGLNALKTPASHQTTTAGQSQPAQTDQTNKIPVTTSRIPSKPSGLARPTSVKQLVSSTTPTSSRQQPTRLASPVPKLALNSTPKSVNVEKSKALAKVSVPQTQTKTSSAISRIDISNIENDVGEIRRVLEQLYALLKAESRVT